MKIESYEDKYAKQRFLNKCKFICGICITIICYLVFQY